MASAAGKFRQLQLTLNGSAQQLSDAVEQLDSGGTIDVTTSREWDPVASYITLQADDGNGAAVYVGFDDVVSATNYAIRIPAPPSNVPGDPLKLEGPIQLRNVWVIGTNTQKLNVGVAVR